MSKHSTQFKLKVVKEYLKLGGLKRIAHLHAISTSDIRNWTLAYQIHGLPSLQKRVLQHYTPEFKLSVLRYMKDHQVSLRPTAAHFNIPGGSIIRTWQHLYNEGGIAALQPKPKGPVSMPKPFDIKALLKKPLAELTPAEMRRRLEYSEAENAYLKKIDALVQSKKLVNKAKPKSSPN
jgi:transposase